MTSVRVAAVQAEPVWFDLAATTEKTIALISEAAAGGAELVAFPETWLPGYPAFIWSQNVIEQLPLIAHYRANSPAVDGPEIMAIREAAAANGIMVVLGFSERDQGSLYMSQMIIGARGETLVHRRKLKPTHVERALFGESDGSGLQVVDTQLGRVGALNCWEHMQPLVKFAMYAQHEQIHVAGWPALSTAAEAPLAQLSGLACLTLSRAYALEGSVFVIVPKQVLPAGPEGSVTDASTQLDAVVYGPDGSVVSTPISSREGVVYADIDLAAASLAKVFADPVGHYSRPDVFQLTIDRSARVVVGIDGTMPDAVPLPEIAADEVVSV
jgi:predicted amidohydrolase